MSLHTGQRIDWDLWLDDARSPAMNMAVDRALLDSATLRNRPVVRFYSWDRPACSIGLFQNADSAIPGLEFVRRPTGGGVVDHRNDFTYSVIFPTSHPICRVNRQDSYAYVNGAVVEALRTLAYDAQLTDREIPDYVDRRTMVCFSSPTRYDVLVNGCKVAGAAQRRTRQGILHQGSIDLGPLGNSRRNSVETALTEAFRQVLGGQGGRFEGQSALIEVAGGICQSRFGCDAWNYRT